MARWVRSGLAVSSPFVSRCLIIRTILRFHIPLVEPDRQFSRIRLPEETSRVRSRKAAFPLCKPDKPKRGVQAVVSKPPERRPFHFVLDEAIQIHKELAAWDPAHYGDSLASDYYLSSQWLETKDPARACEFVGQAADAARNSEMKQGFQTEFQDCRKNATP